MTDILIRGMEMPNDGVEWICFVKITNGTVEFYDPTGENESVFYEAVQLPPHGRLIDADDFIRQKTEQICKNCDRRRGMKDGKLTKRFVYEIGDAPCRACGIGDMLDYVDDAPTIIPASEVQDNA